MKPMGYLMPRRSAEIADSPWGIHAHGAFMFPDQYPVARIREMTLDTGIKWARVVVHWRAHEKSAGSFDWRILDEEVNAWLAGGVHVFFTICADPIPNHHEGGGKRYAPAARTAANEAAFLRYVTELAGHFGDRVRTYEFFNEPLLGGWSPAEYGRLVAQAGATLHETRPDAQVLVYTEPKPELAAELVAQPGLPEQANLFNYHYYAAAPEEMTETMTRTREAVRARCPGAPFWVGECGYAASGDAIHGRRHSPWGYNIQAKLLLRHFFNDRLNGIVRSFYFLNVDFFAPCPGRGCGLGTYGLIQHGTWAPRPAYYAMRNLTAAIDATWTPVTETAELEIVAPGCFLGIGPHETRFPCVPCQFVLRRAGLPMLAYWLPWRAQDQVRPATVRIAMPGHAWHEPVLLDLLSGQAHRPKLAGAAAEVPLADYPLLLTEGAGLTFTPTRQQPAYEAIIKKLAWTYQTDPRFVFAT